MQEIMPQLDKTIFFKYEFCINTIQILSSMDNIKTTFSGIG